MKKIWKHSWAAAIFGTTAFVTTSTSQAEVTVYWEEVTNNGKTAVVATWTGTLNPGTFAGEVSFADVAGLLTASDDTLFGAGVNATGDVWVDGMFASSGFELVLSGGEDIISGASVFGFVDYAFVYASSTPGGADSASINFDSTPHTLTFPDNTLADMNADNFSDTLAWTSSTGDTISYTTGSPPTGSISAIPEPSSGLVLGSLVLSGLMHRRRK